jgi:tetratricopeptide (TPR) repeat protein
LVISLLAVALADAGAVRWVSASAWPGRHRLVLVAGTLTIVASLAPAALLGDASGIAHHAGIEAAAEGRDDAARDHLILATVLDRWHPAPPKALAVAAARAGDADIARAAAGRAVALNPGDGRSWANLALLCLEAGDEACARESAHRAAGSASFLGLELANAALVQESTDRAAAADDAYARSLLSQRLTAFGLPWPRNVSLDDANLPESAGASGELNRVLAGWAVDEPLKPADVSSPTIRALVHAMAGNVEAAAPLLDEALASSPEDPLPWQIAIVLREAWGQRIDDELEAWNALSGSDFPAPHAESTPRVSTRDIASFRSYPGDELVPAAERLETDPIWPWVLRATLP